MVKLKWWYLTSLVLLSWSSCELVDRASAQWVPSSLSPNPLHNLSLVSPTLSHSPWPEEFPWNFNWNINRFGDGLAEALSDVSSVRVSIIHPGRLYTLRGQLIIFKVAFDNLVDEWPRYAPATWNVGPLPILVVERVLILDFKGHEALSEHPKKKYLWWLCREVAREMELIYLNHGPKTTEVQISVDWHNEPTTPLGILRLNLKAPPPVVHTRYWPASVMDLPWRQSIKDEAPERTYLVLKHPRGVLPWLPRGYWFTADPIRMAIAVDLFRDAERAMVSPPRLWNRENVEVAGFRRVDAFAAYYLEVHGTHEGQISVIWRKLLAIRVWATLRDLTGRYGLVIGVFEVYDAGLPVGYVELGEWKGGHR